VKQQMSPPPNPWFVHVLAEQQARIARDAPAIARAPQTITIPSRSTDRDYGRSDFFEIVAFRRACETNGIPLGTPIAIEAHRLAWEAFRLSAHHPVDAVKAWDVARAALNSIKEVA
jgi:hypothetical protein